MPSLEPGQTAVCGNCKTPLTAASNGNGHPIELSDANFQSAIAKGDFVVDFWAGWCGPCRIIAPVIERLASERHDVRFGKLDVDRHKRTAAAYRVQGIPLLVFFRNGAEVGRVVGAVPKAQIEAAIDRYFR